MIRAAGFLAVLGFIVVGLAACQNQVQTTSGSQYLNRYAEASGDSWFEAMDPAVQHAAKVEPILTFPARIGLARIDRGYMTPVPAAEAEAWATVAKSLGPGYGDFVPISPLVVALANANPSVCTDCDETTRARANIAKTVSDIRVGAARQHVDAVLVYETFAKSEQTSNPLAVTKLALIGFFLAPSENIEADGYAQAVLLDVRNGYTYGYAAVVAEDAAFSLSTSVDADVSTLSAQERAKSAAAVELAKDVEQMVRRLRLELAELRAFDAAAMVE